MRGPSAEYGRSGDGAPQHEPGVRHSGICIVMPAFQLSGSPPSTRGLFSFAASDVNKHLI